MESNGEKRPVEEAGDRIRNSRNPPASPWPLPEHPRLHVAVAAEDADDLDAAPTGAVEHHVIPVGKAAHPFREVAAVAAHLRVVGIGLRRAVDVPQEGAGAGRVVAADIPADRGQIGPGAPCQADLRHGAIPAAAP